jgi:hypothetical protein
MKYYYMIMNFEYADYKDFLTDIIDPSSVSSCVCSLMPTGLFEHVNNAFDKAKDLQRQELETYDEADIDRCEQIPLDCAAIIFKDGTVSSYQVIKMEVHK